MAPIPNRKFDITINRRDIVRKLGEAPPGTSVDIIAYAHAPGEDDIEIRILPMGPSFIFDPLQARLPDYDPCLELSVTIPPQDPPAAVTDIDGLASELRGENVVEFLSHAAELLPLLERNIPLGGTNAALRAAHNLEHLEDELLLLFAEDDPAQFTIRCEIIEPYLQLFEQSCAFLLSDEQLEDVERLWLAFAPMRLRRLVNSTTSAFLDYYAGEW